MVRIAVGSKVYMMGTLARIVAPGSKDHIVAGMVPGTEVGMAVGMVGTGHNISAGSMADRKADSSYCSNRMDRRSNHTSGYSLLS